MTSRESAYCRPPAAASQVLARSSLVDGGHTWLLRAAAMEPRATRRLTFHGAVVTLVGLLAGIPYAMVATGRVVGSERAWRFAHVGNILGGIFLLAVAGVADRLDLVPARRTLLVWSLVRGLIPGGSLANTLVYVLLAVGAAGALLGMGLLALGSRARGPRAG